MLRMADIRRLLMLREENLLQQRLRQQPENPKMIWEISPMPPQLVGCHRAARRLKPPFPPAPRLQRRSRNKTLKPVLMSHLM
jgi:hypothetical protein